MLLSIMSTLWEYVVKRRNPHRSFRIAMSPMQQDYKMFKKLYDFIEESPQTSKQGC